jgi:hypothetical protein
MPSTSEVTALLKIPNIVAPLLRSYVAVNGEKYLEDAMPKREKIVVRICELLNRGDASGMRAQNLCSLLVRLVYNQWRDTNRPHRADLPRIRRRNQGRINPVLRCSFPVLSAHRNLRRL